MSELKKNTNREYYLDVARVLSMISVIMIHVGAISWYDAPFSLYPWGIYNLFDLLSRYCVPVFLMISGYIFLNPDKDIPVKKIYTRYLPRLICAFLFWSFLYALITSGFLTQRTLSGGVGAALAHDTFWGHYHMWYMYLIVAFYILTPAVRPLATNRKALRYFLIVSYIFSYLIPNIQMISVVYKYTGPYLNRLEMQFISGYVFYFVAGYYFATEDFDKKQRKILYLVGALGFAFTLITTTSYMLINQYPNSTLHEYYTAGVPLFSIAVFVFFRYRFADVNPDTKLMKVVMWMSKLSFGVYMAHDFGLIVFKKIGLTPAICTPFISMPLLTAMDLAITICIIWIISKVPVLKKWII